MSSRSTSRQRPRELPVSDNPVIPSVEAIGSAGPAPENNATSEPIVNFPKIHRHVFDVIHDDERNEVWVGIRLRSTAKGRIEKDGPIEDVEVGLDPISIIISLDAAKQEVLMALSQDNQKLSAERQRKLALKTTGLLGRINSGLKSLAH